MGSKQENGTESELAFGNGCRLWAATGLYEAGLLDQQPTTPSRPVEEEVEREPLADVPAKMILCVNRY